MSPKSEADSSQLRRLDRPPERRQAEAETGTEIARWVEVNVIRLRRVGLSFQKIPELLIAAGRGGDRADMKMPPAGLQLPMDHSITAMGVFQAYAKVMNGAPSPKATQWDKEQVERCDIVWRKMQPNLNNDRASAAMEALKAIEVASKLLGTHAPVKIDFEQRRRRQNSGAGIRYSIRSTNANGRRPSRPNRIRSRMMTHGSQSGDQTRSRAGKAKFLTRTLSGLGLLTTDSLPRPRAN
jgi:hypothetical protein